MEREEGRKQREKEGVTLYNILLVCERNGSPTLGLYHLFNQSQ